MSHENITYAQALLSSKIPAAAIRNVRIMGTPDEATATAATLRKDQEFAGANIREIAQKGQYNLTIKCRSGEDAEKVEKELKERYKDKVEISNPKESPPMVKITNMSVEEMNQIEMVNIMRKANYWMNELKFDVVDVYKINTRTGDYTNMILSCDIPTQKVFLDRKKLIFGLTACKIHEQINTIQCKRCQRHGHFQRNCTFNTQCRRCAEEHTIEERTVNDAK